MGKIAKWGIAASAIASLLVTLSGPAIAAGGVTPGSSCTKAGTTKTVAAKKYTCIKSGKKLVWNKGVDTKAWQQAFDCLVEGNQSWVKDAPFLCLICADTLFSKNGQANRWAEYDTGAAAQNLCLQASSMGLSAHQLGGFNADKARATFNIPAQFTLMAMISVGYLADITTVKGDLLARETSPRSRRELGALFFDGAWDKPII